MNAPKRKVSKKDLILLAITMQEERKTKRVERPKIHIGINRKYIGLTQKERDEINE